MAVKYYNYYNSQDLFAGGDMAKVRRLDAYIDFTDTDNQTAAASDSLALFHLPVGTFIVGGGIEQITAGDSGNTLQARVGTVALSSTLASDATAGTFTTTVTTALDGNAATLSEISRNIATAVDFNLLSASAVRSTGKARAWIIIIEGDTRVNYPSLAQRDTSA